MKLKDFVYDLDLKKATIFLEEVEPEQLEDLLLFADIDRKQPKEREDYESIIFSESN